MIAKRFGVSLAAAVFGCFVTWARHPPAALLRAAFVLLQKGDVAGARQVYVYLAFNGNADGARGVGDTYNPLVLQALSNTNALGNEDQASFWYARAMQMEVRATRPQEPARRTGEYDRAPYVAPARGARGGQAFFKG